MYPFGYLQPVRPARLPLIDGILVNPEGPLGRRLVARHDDLSYQSMVDRRQARWERLGRPVREPVCINITERGVCTDRHCLICS